MFDIGFGEILVCAVVALVVLGPERLPGAVRTVGRWVGRARHTVNHFTDQIEREMRAEELRRRIDEEIQKTGVDQAKRELEAVRRALDAPAVGAEHLRAPVENSILPPPAVPAAPADAVQPPVPTPAAAPAEPTSTGTDRAP